ncbi:retinol dehydrogenase 13-like [Brachionus plicatilis]|uniref:Retinol dehydrogenase 13-like n=1 Tax=Brachionus plicatilis TaxID=10195 RepID=A0A3M7QGF9_BRAPC|nr:retinol dehydrogenase 13-like [Brachionus plicatilis]
MENIMSFIKNNQKEIILGSVLFFGVVLIKRKLRSNPQFELIKNIRLNEKVAIITGANTGIGYETALDLAKRGATVILACRNMNESQKAAEKIKRQSGNSNVCIEKLDLASFESIRNFCSKIMADYKKIDILVNNAGIASCPKQVTVDGFDLQLQTNYLGHFLLTRLLLESLKQSNDCRVVNLTSKLYEKASIRWNDINMSENYSPMEMYTQSKLCLILFTNYMKDYLRQLGIGNIKAYSVSPGFVLTELSRYREKNLILKILKFIFYPLIWYLLRTPRQGAECSIYCCVKPNLVEKEGFYFRNCEPTKLLPHVDNKNDEVRLWNLSENLLKECNV